MLRSRSLVRIGVAGVGYWGPNLVRVFNALPDGRVAALSDLNAERLEEIVQQAPVTLATTEVDELLDPRIVDAVVMATPTRTHHALARKALQRGLHVFVEKPLATSVEECDELIELAAARNRVLFVGHVFLYAPAVITLKELIQRGDLGRISYISCVRLNLGPVRRDVNALWDLAPHDISILLELMGEPPVAVNCQGLAYLNDRVHDVCALSLRFSDRSMALVHVSWLDPSKRRLVTVVGDRKMAIYDDLEPSEKVKVYDKGVETPPKPDLFTGYQLSYRYGDTYSPRIKETEPLKAECQHFVECIRDGRTPKTDGVLGREVVRVLQAAQASLDNGGGRVDVAEARLAAGQAR
ncbi:MAG: Gfo/Idh/MocA family protein [Candidatus Methylomirabilales bacterium]